VQQQTELTQTMERFAPCKTPQKHVRNSLIKPWTL